MFSYMYDLNKYDISSSMGQLGSSCGMVGQQGRSRRCSSRDLRRSKSVHLMELVPERRPKSHRFWRERRVVGDVNGQVRLIDLEAALPHSNHSAWCLSFDGEPSLDSVRYSYRC